MFKSLLLKGRTLCLLLCCLISSLVVTAQTKRTGKVIGNDDKQPLVGASVRIKGTNQGDVTNVNGEFTLNISAGNVLVVSYLTYETKEVTVEGDGPITIMLTPSNNSLNEVVVTGYAVQKKKDLVGAVTVVDVAAANRQPTGSVENQLQGQAAGVTVITSGQPGETPQVKIRGANTFGNNQPLYVVDGVPTTNVADLNPNDVQTMQVLKDAGSASIYGARAANGVIIITTKKGSGKVSISYDGYYGTQVPKGGNVWDILTPQEMVTLQKQAITNTAAVNGVPPVYASNLYGPNDDTLPDYINPAGAHEGDASVDPSLYNVNPFYTNADDLGSFYRITRANKAGTDWYHEIFKTAPITSHNVALSGSTDAATYLFSMNYFNQQGTLIDTYDKRYTIRANTSFNVSKHFRVGENLSYSATINPTQGENNEGSTIGMGFREQPIIPVYDIMGNYAGSNTGGLGNARNPVAIGERTKDNYGVGTRLFGNVFAEADLFKYFTLRTEFGGEYYSGFNHSFGYPEYENSENNVTNTYYQSSYSGYNFTWTNTLRYAQTIGKHNISVLVGTEAYQNSGESLNAQNTGYFTFDPNYVNISTGTGTPVASSGFNKDRIFSYIGRVDYTFNEKYLLNATIRRDGSSRFLNYQEGWFPAASIGWRISQENFMKGISWINDLKIRGGYGVLGNQINVDPSNAFTTYAANKASSYYDLTGSSTTTVSGFQKAHIGNPDAQWELDKNTNVGFDAVLFNQKLEITADYYKKDISRLLFNPALPATGGAAAQPFQNVGAATNNGVDISLATHGNISSDLRFNASLSFTTYHNEIKAVSLSQDYFEVDGGRFGLSIVRNQVGSPVSAFYGYKVDGFWNSQGEIDAANAAASAKTGVTGTTYEDNMAVGRFKYADVNGDGIVNDADRTVIGNPNPKFTSGLNFGLNYKAWDFNMFWYWSYGAQIFDDIKWWTDFYGDFGGAKSKTALYDSWTPTHMNASAPIQETVGYTSTSSVPNSYFIQPGSYLRLKNAQIGYTFAPQVLKNLGMSKLRIYVSGANLITITKYTGPDPEIVGGPNAGASIDFGVDRGNYSPNRTYLIGAQVKF